MVSKLVDAAVEKKANPVLMERLKGLTSVTVSVEGNAPVWARSAMPEDGVETGPPPPGTNFNAPPPGSPPPGWHGHRGGDGLPYAAAAAASAAAADTASAAAAVGVLDPADDAVEASTARMPTDRNPLLLSAKMRQAKVQRRLAQAARRIAPEEVEAGLDRR